MDLTLTVVISLLVQFVACAYLRARWSLVIAFLFPPALAYLILIFALSNRSEWPDWATSIWILYFVPAIMVCLLTAIIMIWLKKRSHGEREINIAAMALFSAGLVLVLVIAWDAVEFFGGYSFFPLGWPFYIVPTSALVWFLTILASCWAAMLLTTSLVRRRFRSATILAIVLCVSWALSPWFFARSLFLHGLAARLRAFTSPGYIESAAQLCLSLMPAGERIASPRWGKDDEENKKAWDALSNYKFVHFREDTCTAFVGPTDVSFEWGGPLTGHWGFCVLGANQDAPMSDGHVREFLNSIRYSDKVIVYVDH